MNTFIICENISNKITYSIKLCLLICEHILDLICFCHKSWLVQLLKHKIK